jgi:hypothetical protein
MHVRCQMQRPTTRVFPGACSVQWIAVCVAFSEEAAPPGLINRVSFLIFNMSWNHPLSRKVRV